MSTSLDEALIRLDEICNLAPDPQFDRIDPRLVPLVANLLSAYFTKGALFGKTPEVFIYPTPEGNIMLEMRNLEITLSMVDNDYLNFDGFVKING